MGKLHPRMIQDPIRRFMRKSRRRNEQQRFRAQAYSDEAGISVELDPCRSLCDELGEKISDQEIGDDPGCHAENSQYDAQNHMPFIRAGYRKEPLNTFMHASSLSERTSYLSTILLI